MIFGAHEEMDYQPRDVTNVSDINEFDCVIIRSKKILIGPHQFNSPKEVTFTTASIRIVAPLVTDPETTRELKIYYDEIIWSESYFSVKQMPLICLCITAKCAKYVLNALKIKDNDDEKCSGNEKFLKIFILFDGLPLVSIDIVRDILKGNDEINSNDVQQINEDKNLFNDRQASDETIEPNNSANSDNSLTTNEVLLIYPSGKYGIPITNEDLMCLNTGQFLNDIIIDFYMKWIHNNLIAICERDKTFIFSSHFYTTMTICSDQDKKDKQIAAQERHDRVRKWTKHVNLFEKDFIIIPINEKSHWFLAIICFPRLTGPVEFDTNVLVDPSDCNNGTATTHLRAIKQPLILIFDSLASKPRKHIFPTLRDYLTCEYRLKMPANAPERVFTAKNMPGHSVKVPQQDNCTDCGLYLLQNFESFYTDPIKDYRLPINQLSNWFDTITATRKREEISDLLTCLIDDFRNSNGTEQKRVTPYIPFPKPNWAFYEESENSCDNTSDATTSHLSTSSTFIQSDVVITASNNSSPRTPTQGKEIGRKRRLSNSSTRSNLDETASSDLPITTIRGTDAHSNTSKSVKRRKLE